MAENKLELTATMLNSCGKPAEIMELPAVKDRWVQTYAMTTGKTDGELRFEAEKVLFIQTVSESPALAKCTPMSIYSSFILLAVSGLSLNDSECYLIPYGSKCGFMVGWKGRKKQISQIPGVQYFNEPICVFEGEDFEYEIIDGEYRILRHKPLLDTTGKDILAVYATIRYEFGVKTFLMKKEEVLSIRNNYSSSYKDYIRIEPNKDGKRMKKYKDKQTGEWKEFELEPPMWVTDEVQAWKKTLIHRIYNTITKSAVQKYLDKEIKDTLKDMNAEEESIEEQLKTVTDVSDATFEEIVDVETGEIQETKTESIAPDGITTQESLFEGDSF